MPLTNQILMVRPANFGFNPETAKDNAFQEVPKSTSEETIAARAVKEFDEFVTKLEEVGIEVLVVQDSDKPEKTDAVFPNNWISTHAGGTVITYPMYSKNRRLERRPEIVNAIREKWQVERHLALESWEERHGMMLEGTGALVLDHDHEIAYACLSKRATQAALDEWCEMTGYLAVPFNGVDPSGLPIYHTNVIMAVGKSQVVLSTECVIPEDRHRVVATIGQTGKTLVDLSWPQIQQFAGNMLQLKGKFGPVWVMSSQAYSSLTTEQAEQLQSDGSQILHADLKTIETYGGGSARCMLAEIFLPERRE
ncbi:MAG: arginine deiminase-related protein [Bacteroidota bacterium]